MYHKSEAEIMATWECVDHPVVSVWSITYNHEAYIAQALDSFLMQETTFPFEIVVGEDCSTDNTMTILKQYQEKYPNIIRIITSEHNVGVNANFLRTLQACQGKYIALCEGDDYWTDPQKLQKQYECMEANPQASCCFHAVDNVDDAGLIVAKYNPRHNDYHYHEYSRSESMQCIPGISTRAVFFRRYQWFDSFPNEVYHVLNIDSFLYTVLGFYGTSIYLPNVSPSIYRITGEGVWTSIKDHKLRTFHAFKLDFAKALFLERMGESQMSKYYYQRSFRVHSRIVPLRVEFMLLVVSFFRKLLRK